MLGDVQFAGRIAEPAKHQHQGQRPASSQESTDQRTCYWYDKEITYVKEEIRPQLLNLANWMGLVGGITTHQVGPWKGADGQLGHRHQLGLLGEIIFTDDNEKRQFFTEIQEYFKPSRPGLINVMGIPQPIEFIFSPANHPSTMRSLLAGSSVSYPIANLPLIRGTTEPKARRLDDGIPGVLSLQPTCLFNDMMWWRFANATRGIKLFSPFGTWKKYFAGFKRQLSQQRRQHKYGRPQKHLRRRRPLL
jgi:hypothetical protein